MLPGCRLPLMSEMFERLSLVARRLFSIDLRSLAAFRIALASLVLVDLLLRSRFIQENYTDGGVFPRSLYSLKPTRFVFEVHALAGSYAFVAALFVLSALSAVCLLIGYRTRTATLISWLLVSSLQLRNTYLLDGGDLLLRLCLFWSIFLPLGARLSVDARLSGKHRAGSSSLLSVAGVAILLQFVFLYFFAGLNKSGPTWMSSGTAIELVLGDVYWTKPLGNALRQVPGLLRFLTPLVVWFEMLGPFLMFVPWRTDTVRAFCIPAFIGLQLGFWLCIELHLFSFIASSLTLLFIPTAFWERLQRRWRFSPPYRKNAVGSVQESRFSAVLHSVRSRLGPLGLSLLILYALLMNLGSGGRMHWPRGFYALAESLGIVQSWPLYAPDPPSYTYSFMLEGHLRDATTVDLVHTTAHPDWDDVRRLYDSYRFKYTMQRRKPKRLLLRQLEWLCERWNQVEEGVPALRRIVFTRRDTRISSQATGGDARSAKPRVRRLRIGHTCATSR